jgi:hypothetical protein
MQSRLGLLGVCLCVALVVLIIDGEPQESELSLMLKLLIQ